MSPIARADKKARTVFGKAEKQQAHCKLLSDKPLRQRALAGKKRKAFLEIKLTMQGKRTHMPLKLFLEKHLSGGYFGLGC